MKPILIFGFSVLIMSSCIRSNNGHIAYLTGEKDLIAEGITYSSATGSFYLGSIYKKKIIRINAETGEVSNFFQSDSLNFSFLGLLVDDVNNYLWACGYSHNNKIRRSSVLKFDLISGKLIRSYSCNDTLPDLYNDLAEDKTGNVYFTDTDNQCIYKIDRYTDSIIVIFRGTQVLQPNGITISPDNRYLYVASTNYGIRVLDVENQSIVGEPDTLFNSTGIDGLKYYRNSLIGIQNDVKTKSEVKIIQYFLDNSGTKIKGVKIIDQNNPSFDIPTTFVIFDQNLYCLANSQIWNLDSSENRILNEQMLNETKILTYNLQ